MNTILKTVSALSLGIVLLPLRFSDGGNTQIRAEGMVRRQTYCYADADLFTASLKIDIKVTNPSSKVVYISSDLIPYVGRVAASVHKAQSGDYLYELVWSHYLVDKMDPPGAIKIDPGKSVVLRSGYDVPARYREDAVLPKTVPPGSYALQLVLRPARVPAKQEQAPTQKVIESIATEPIRFEIPRHPPVVECTQGGSGAGPDPGAPEALSSPLRRGQTAGASPGKL